MSLDAALDADRRGDIETAADLYEESLPGDLSSVLAVVNLAVLYWQATDYGLWTTLGLSREFVARAAKRFPELLRDGQERFPTAPDVTFWSKYIAWADLGQPMSLNECQLLLANNPGYLEPAMFLFSTSQGSVCAREALQLLQQAEKDGTCRARYVASVVAATIKHLRTPGGMRS